MKDFIIDFSSDQFKCIIHQTIHQMYHPSNVPSIQTRKRFNQTSKNFKDSLINVQCDQFLEGCYHF